MNKVTGIKSDFLVNFLKSFQENLEKIENKEAIYGQTLFNNLSTNAQQEFLSALKNLHGDVWAMKKELELIDTLINKLFASGPLNQFSENLLSKEGLKELSNLINNVKSSKDDGTFH